jgi:hypothetical protein
MKLSSSHEKPHPPAYRQAGNPSPIERGANRIFTIKTIREFVATLCKT